MNLSLRCKSLLDVFSQLSIPITAPSENLLPAIHDSSDWFLFRLQRHRGMTLGTDNNIYELWLSSRALHHNNIDQHLVPGANRPLTSRNFRAAGKILTLCSWDLVSRLCALHPVRTILLVLLELLRGLFPAARGYSQALLLNEVCNTDWLDS